MTRPSLVLLALVCALRHVSLADEPTNVVPGTERTKSRSRRISPDPLGPFRAGLEKRVKLEFVDAPLKDVIAHLSKQAGVPIRLDELALENADVPLDEAITLRSRGIPVKTALARLLEPLDLGWVIENEEVVVMDSIDIESRGRLVIGIYDVRPLLEHPPRRERLQRLIDGPREYPVGSGFGPGGFGLGGGGGAFFQIGPGPGLGGGLGGFPPAFQRWRPRDPYGEEWLITLIEWMIGPPASWADQGGPAQVWDSEGRYLVRHLLSAHDDLDALLTALDGLTGGPTKSVVRPFESEGERRIRLALDRRISVQFNETPLDEFARVLGDELGVDVELEALALDEEGIPLDEPITVAAEETSVRAILARVLERLNPRWIVNKERLLITSSIVSEELGNLEYALVDARDLVPSLGGTQPLIDSIAIQTGPPESWADQGGPGDISPIMGGVLVVRQTEDVIREIEGVVASLRKSAGDRPPKPMPKPEDVRMLDYTLSEHDPDEVRELVEVAIDGQWDNRDWMRVVGKQLFVKSTLANHLAIDRLLNKLKPLKRDESTPSKSDARPASED